MFVNIVNTQSGRCLSFANRFGGCYRKEHWNRKGAKDAKNPQRTAIEYGRNPWVRAPTDVAAVVVQKRCV